MSTLAEPSRSFTTSSRLDSEADHQQTLASPVRVRGVGFVSGIDVDLRFMPAPSNSGISFVRTDLPGSPAIPATVAHIVPRRRRTALALDEAVVEMTEHVLAALAGQGIDNCRIELDGPETPGMDGSALAFVEAIRDAGIQSLPARRKPLVIEESIVVRDEGAFVAVVPADGAGLDVTFNLQYDQSPGIGRQSRMLSVNPDTFANEIAPARTFVLMTEIEELRRQGLGSRVSASDLLVFDLDGAVVDNQLRFADECVRHKILDVVGDLALVGRPIQGHVLAHRSGHLLNTALARKVIEADTARRSDRKLARRPLLDAVQIEKILPHRYPFLLVDRILELDPNRWVLGFKNVTYNEPFFRGHFPGAPVMPGVLILEAMAQLAGVMLTQWQEREGAQYGMIVSMDGVKLRRPVVPGDQLCLQARSTRVKSRTAVVQSEALVNDEPAAEALFRFVLIEPNESPA